jgi:hypothetical protein
MLFFENNLLRHFATAAPLSIASRPTLNPSQRAFLFNRV